MVLNKNTANLIRRLNTIAKNKRIGHSKFDSRATKIILVGDRRKKGQNNEHFLHPPPFKALIKALP